MYLALRRIVRIYAITWFFSLNLPYPRHYLKKNQKIFTRSLMNSSFETENDLLSLYQSCPDYYLVPESSLDSVWTKFKKYFWDLSRLSPDSYLFLFWSRLRTDSCLDRVWTKLENIFFILSRHSPDWSLVPDKNLDIKKSRLWTKSGLVPIVDISDFERIFETYKIAMTMIISPLTAVLLM